MSSLIFNIFGSSPIAPLQQHMQVANQCAGRLPDFFAAVIADNWELAESIQNEMR